MNLTMRRMSIGLAILVLATCARDGQKQGQAAWRGITAEAPQTERSSLAVRWNQGVVLGECPVSPYASDPATPPGAVSSQPTYYRSADARLWMLKDSVWYAGGIKVAWFKPAGVQLQVTGRRLDGPAPPLQTDIPEGYDGEFQSSSLLFPSPGCWEVEATADGSSLRFVVAVYPRSYRPAQRECPDLRTVAHNSQVIIVAIMEASTPDWPGFARQTVRVEQVWKGPVAEGGRLEVLQGPTESALVVGATYVLFLTAHLGAPWRIICPERTRIAVAGEHLILPAAGGEQPLSLADTLTSLQATVMEALR